MNRPSRRAFLGSAAAAAAALAGCTANGTDSDGGGGGGGSPESTGTAAGTAAVDGLRLQTLDVEGSPGGEFSIDPTGTPVLVDFFATWCAPCKPQMAHLRTVYREFDDLRMTSITRETDEDAIAEFWREYEGVWPVAMDPELRAFEKYGVTRVPVKVVLDGEGTEAWRHAGLADADTIRSAVEEAQA